MEREVLELALEQQRIISEYERFVMEIATMLRDKRSHSVISFDEEKTPLLNWVGGEVSLMIDYVNGNLPEEEPESGVVVT